MNRSHDFQITIEGRFIHQYGLNALPLLIYALLRDCTIKEGGFMESYTVIADKLGITYSTVNKTVNNLILSGLASYDKVPDAEGRVVKIIKIIKL